MSETTQPIGPLNGVTVVDLTRILAGPYCTMVLNDLGARVIKVERPGTGDDSRHIGPFVNGVSAYFASLNRGKESVSLDLDDETDRLRFEELLTDADVLVENFRPGVMQRLGFGWETLHARFPQLIYAAVSGFGQTGPYANRPAYDMVVQGMGGLMSITGEPDGEPVRVGTSIGDLSAGLFTIVGVITALYHRSLTGESQLVDIGMLDCQVAILENAIARYVATGESPGPLGARHPSITPFGAFQASDGHLIVAAGHDKLFKRLCSSIDRSDLVDDPRFSSNHLRTENNVELEAELNHTLSQETVAHWLVVLGNADIPCGPINNVAQVLNDPQVRARNMVVPVDDDTLGLFEVAGNPVKLSAFTDPTSRGAVPKLER